MPEPRDELDATLRDRMAAAESRVRVSSAPPAGARAGSPARWARPALMLATAAAAAVLAVTVLGQLPDRSAGGPTASPSTAGGVSASARNGDFVLTLSSPRSAWTTEDDIQISATLTYDGDDPEVEIGGGGGPVVFSLRQVEGGDAVLGGGQDLPCLRYRLGPNAALVWPFEKSGAVDDNPPFDRTFFEEPQLHLPPGRWQVGAILEFGDTDCANWRELEVSIDLDVVEAEGSPGPSEPATPGPAEDDVQTLTGVLEGDPELEGGCVWLRDESNQRWEVIWPDGYQATFRDGPVLLRGVHTIAAGGDRITVRGRTPSGVGSHCMVGIVFEAESVELQ